MKTKLFIFAAFAALLLASCKDLAEPENPRILVTDISITNPANPFPLVKGTTYQIKATVLPENASDKKISYSSNTPTIADVDAKGLITANAVGTATITLKAANVSKTITVTVTAVRINVIEVSVSSADEKISIVKGRTHQLSAAVKPDNATDKTLTYSSRDTNVATVNANGLIAAKTAGNTTLTIKAADGVSKTINVTVTEAEIPVTSIVFEPPLPAEPLELTIGDNYELKLKVMPENATNKMLSVASSNDDIAWPNEKGNRWIKAKQAGSATITITSVGTPAVKRDVLFVIKNPPEIKYDSKTAVMAESAAGTYTFELQTLNGKLEYEPIFTSNKLPWITGVPAIVSRDNPDKDVISFTCTENKTVWDRRAYIKFKDKKTGKYIKGADGKEIEVRILQKRNEHPVIHYKWVKGIDEPIAGQTEKMPIIHNSTPTGNYYEQPYVFKWNETADTKFYNARKLSKLRRDGFPNNYFVVTETINNIPRQGTDLSQCWAKTASNMLHWWFEQNKTYIEQYKTKSNIAPNSLLYRHNYVRNLPDEREGEKSNIANNFRIYTHDEDRGGYIEDALTWYLYKRDSQKNLGSIHPALFNDVFTFDTRPISTERCETKKEFERIMNEAFDKGRAIGLFWKGFHGKKLYQHAVTCWGAAYDGEDNIVCLYIAESNLTGAALYPYGVHYRGNIYDEPEQNRTYMYNYYLSRLEDIYVDSITTLDLGEQQWQKWLSEHP